MSNTVYPKARDAIGAAGVDLTTADIRVILVNDSAAYNAAHDFLDDLGANTVGTAVALAGRALSSGLLTSTTTTATFSGVAAATVISGAVYYVHTGVAATSRLIAWIDTNADGTPISVTATGADIAYTVPSPLLRL